MKSRLLAKYSTIYQYYISSCADLLQFRLAISSADADKHTRRV